MATAFGTHYEICVAFQNGKPRTLPFSELPAIANGLIARRAASGGVGSQIGRHKSVTDRLTAGESWRTQALEELWRTHAKKLLRITQRITRNEKDAEDA